ncbi:MAG TPA: hypothetical protein DHV36_18570 [Desulfobacteraceae bacterium]|nr:hypothetical protein [Desulfobacteraceae bacterium]|tara:strand:+ start:346 stop:624 length:279 start_codon:yes stop_codon:yes gene_type:complete
MNRQEFESYMNNWLKTWGQTIHDIETQNGGAPSEVYKAKLDEMKIVLHDMRTKVEDLQNSKDDKSWSDMKVRVEDMVGPIEESFKESLAYFH